MMPDYHSYTAPDDDTWDDAAEDRAAKDVEFMTRMWKDAQAEIVKDRGRLLRIKPTRAQQDNSDMLTAAMADMTVAQVFHAVEAHLEARPDVDPSALEAFSDKLRRKAWEKERGA